MSDRIDKIRKLAQQGPSSTKGRVPPRRPVRPNPPPTGQSGSNTSENVGGSSGGDK